MDGGLRKIVNGCVYIFDVTVAQRREKNSGHALVNVRNLTEREHVSRGLSVRKIEEEKKHENIALPVSLNGARGVSRSIDSEEL